MTETTIVLRDFSGDIEITPAAAARKADLILAGKEIVQVTNDDEQSTALTAHRGLKALRTEVENQRKAIKAPVLALGKKIDDIAATFIADAEKEEQRLQGLINHHQQVLMRKRQEAEAAAERERQRIANEAAAAQRAAEEAERKRQQAEIAAQQAEALKGKRKEQAEAEAARLAAEAKRLEEDAFEKSLAAEAIPEPIVPEIEQPKGLTAKTVLDYTVDGRNEFEQHASLIKFAAAHPNLVKIEIKRRDLLDEINAGRITSAPGITIREQLKTTIR